jgi:hypothetical protein
VLAFTDCAFAVVGLVVDLLVLGEFAALGFLDRDGDGVGLALVAQVPRSPLVVYSDNGDLRDFCTVWTV